MLPVAQANHEEDDTGAYTDVDSIYLDLLDVLDSVEVHVPVVAEKAPVKAEPKGKVKGEKETEKERTKLERERERTQAQTGRLTKNAYATTLPAFPVPRPGRPAHCLCRTVRRLRYQGGGCAGGLSLSAKYAAPV